MPRQPHAADAPTLLLFTVLLLFLFPSALETLKGLLLSPFSRLPIFSSTLPPHPAATLPTPLPPGPTPSAQVSSAQDPTMSWFQKTFTLPSKSRGSYLITDHVVSELPEIKNYKVGILHLFAQHTSCGLSLNENWDSDVRADMSDALDRVAPEDRKGDMYRHDAEGLDDMPAHIKSSLVGASITIPISNGRLATGTWQGIWYLEFRASKHSRRVVATIQGEKT